MAPKKFQKVEVDGPDTLQEAMPETTTKVDHHDKPVEPNYGERHIFNCAIPYGGIPRSVNATVNPPELQRGIAKQKQDVAKAVFEHQEYRRDPKGERVLSKLPSDDSDTPETTRTDH